MTSRSAATIMRTADPAADVAVDDAWADAEGRATYEQIIADDGPPLAAVRAPRARRRILIGAGLAAAAGAAAVVVGIPGVNHNGAPPAWSVTKHADGSVTVNINDDRDRAGLQKRLRAAGLRTVITTAPPNCAGIRIGNGSGPRYTGWTVVADTSTFTSAADWQHLLRVPKQPVGGVRPVQGIARWSVAAPAEDARTLTITIVPSALPAGDTVTIAFPPRRSPLDSVLIIQAATTGRPLICQPVPALSGQ